MGVIEDSRMDVMMTRTAVAHRYPTPALEKGLDALELLASGILRSAAAFT